MHGLGIKRESCKKKMAYYLFFFRRFWVELRSPVTQKNIFAKNRYTVVRIVCILLWNLRYQSHVSCPGKTVVL